MFKNDNEFKVGDKAIFCNGVQRPELNGVEVTIDRKLKVRSVLRNGKFNKEACYGVRFPFGLDRGRETALTFQLERVPECDKCN